MGKITQNLNFHLDGNGNGEVSYTKWMAGVKIHAKAQISTPTGNYHVELFVNKSRKLAADITDKQEISTSFGTKFFGNTTIRVTIHSENVHNQNGTIRLEANY